MPSNKKLDVKSREKEEILESIYLSRLERTKLERLFEDLDKYVDDLNILFKSFNKKGCYTKRFYKPDLLNLYSRARHLFNKVKSLERIQNLETKELLLLLKDMKKGKYGKLGKEIVADLNLQKKMDAETVTMENFFKKTLNYFKLTLMYPENLEEPFQGQMYLKNFFKSARYTALEEIEQVNTEIMQLQKDLHMLDK